MTIKLIPDWRKSYRTYSMRAIAVIAALQSVLASLPPDRAELVIGAGVTFADVLVYLTIAAAVIGGIGRIIDQGDA